MPLCKICTNIVSSGILLSDGGMIHDSCLKSIQDKKEEIKSNIHAQQEILNSLKKEIEKRDGLLFKITSLFSKPCIDIEGIQTKIFYIENNVKRLSSMFASFHDSETAIYDYFLTYPPDWKDRKKQVIERDGDNCIRCGDSYHMHLHHIRPLSEGGNNKIINLELLCECCHSEEHNGRVFAEEFSNHETNSSKRVANIRYAINNGRRITFEYKKSEDVFYTQRTVNPTALLNIDHVRNNGSTLCVRGYCELRSAERTFALKKMKGLKII